MPFDNHERISGHPPGDIDRAPRTGQHQVLTPQTISGRLTQMRFPAGGNLWRTNSYAPFGQQDSNGGRLTAIQVGTTQGGSDRLNLGYSYDSFGNISSWTINSALNSFSYDSQNRVTSAFGLSYAYDVAGRFTSFEGTTPIYVNHRLTDFGTQDYYYDNNGNQTYRRWGLSDQQALTWNHENRLRNLSSTSYTESYTYDADGQRILKISNGVSTFYPNQYYEASGSNVTKYYYFGSQRIAMRKNGVLTYLHPDHLGSTAMSTDTGGAVTVNQGYYAYGRYRSGGTLPTDRRYTGQQRDDTGLYYYNARYYDPLLGTFLSPDTIVPDPGNVQAYNRYLYALGNPIKYNDPSGHMNFDPHHCLCGGGAAIAELEERLLSELIATHEQTGLAADKAALETVTAVETQVAASLESAESALAGQYPQAQPSQPVQAPPAAEFTNGQTSDTVSLAKSIESPQINPKDVAGKTPVEIDNFAKQKGLIPKGPDPQNGKGAYVDPVTGNQRILSHPLACPPHCHVNNPAGERLDIDGNIVAPESPDAHLPLKSN